MLPEVGGEGLAIASVNFVALRESCHSHDKQRGNPKCHQRPQTFDAQTILPGIADHNLNAMLSAGAALSAQLQQLYGYSLERIKDLH